MISTKVYVLIVFLVPYLQIIWDATFTSYYQCLFWAVLLFFHFCFFSTHDSVQHHMHVFFVCTIIYLGNDYNYFVLYLEIWYVFTHIRALKVRESVIFKPYFHFPFSLLVPMAFKWYCKSTSSIWNRSLWRCKLFFVI